MRLMNKMSEECTIIIKVLHDDYVELTKYAESDPRHLSVNDFVRELVKAFLDDIVLAVEVLEDEEE